MKKNILILILMALMMIISCKLFTPRDSEEPDKPADWNTFQVTPAKTLENLVFAYNYRENVYNYTYLFSDQFKFHFDTQDVSDFNVPTYWNKTNELDMLMNMYQRINQGSSMELLLATIPNQNDNVQVDRAWYYRNYTLTIQHSLPDIPLEITGKMQIYMEKDNNGFWRIKDWYDYRLSTNWTWGRVKNEFSL